MDILQVQLIKFLEIVAGGTLTVLSVYASAYVKKAIALAKQKSQQIEDVQAKQIVDDTLDKVQDLITTGIEALENTSKKDIITDIEAGKVDKSALNQLSIDLQNNVLNQLGNQGVEILNGVVTDANKYISDKIESTLGQLKLEPTSPVSKTDIKVPEQPVVDTTELTNKLNEVQSNLNNLNQEHQQLQANFDVLNQANSDLSNQKAQLEQDKQLLQSKLDSITNTLSQVVQPVTQPQPVVDTTVQQQQADVNSVVPNTIQ
jgi:hypothetical protein